MEGVLMSELILLAAMILAVAGLGGLLGVLFWNFRNPK